MDTLKRWLVGTLAQEPPSSELAKATGYCLKQWLALTRFVQDGRLGLDNNLCEQQLRDVALGRKISCSRDHTMHRAAQLPSTA